MAITTGNTAPTSATSKTVLEVIVMNDDQFQREALYQATMSMFQAMLRNRLITEEQYKVIDTKMKEKYRPVIGTLCSK
jgi:predicted component of type VI protein secretion system